jgi:peptidyl-prolyl cis-trans isomerase A (cyclophilin A)
MTPMITKRAVLAGAGALAASSALAQTAPMPAPPRVVIETADGPITIELAADKAPITCANFLRYVAARRFDGAVFYRAMKLVSDPLIGLVQGGVKNDPARSYPPIAHESTKMTGLSHKDGTISMARYAPGTATSEFFICIGDIVSLDADPTQSGDNAGFAAFGRVVEGMDVARAILTAPVSPTAGEGVMKGQMLEPEVTILKADRIAA